MLEIFTEATCPGKIEGALCRRKLDRRGVVAIGIRDDSGDGLSFYYEYACPFCGERSVFTGFPITMEDFIADMMEIAELPFTQDGPKKSGISETEINTVKKIMKDARNFEEFMEKIGINKDYIEWLRTQDENKQN